MNQINVKRNYTSFKNGCEFEEENIELHLRKFELFYLFYVKVLKI